MEPAILSPLSSLQQLRAVRTLLTPEGAWRPGYSFGAVDAAGRSCPVRSPEARRWGMLGALVHLGGDCDERLEAFDLLGQAVASSSFRLWEEEGGRTQAEVLHAVDAAIELASGRRRP